jgi:hypothetical protein
MLSKRSPGIGLATPEFVMDLIRARLKQAEQLHARKNQD